MLEQAVRDNAAWCDLVCRTHGLPGVYGPRAWTNPKRTPVLYPDAVTLSPDATPDDVIPAIDAGPGASVKDSFSTLELSPYGFRVLFEAQWMAREPLDPPVELRAASGDEIVWEVVTDVRDWEKAAFPGGELGELFRPALLAEATLVCGRIEDDIVCGAALSPGSGAVGLSNVFAVGCDMRAAFAGAIATAARLHSGRALVGYEWGEELEAAASLGFEPLGPLRVWLRD